MMADQNARSIAKGQFTRAENKLKKDLVADGNSIPVTTFARHRDELIDKWQKVQDIHDAYVLTLVNPDEAQLKTEQAWLDELDERFSASFFGCQL